MSITDEKKYLTDKYATAERMTASDLRMITALLRSPEGCPWDREQTHESVRDNFIEETYEVIEAIDNRDPVLMCEELGDVLLQVMFHARMEEERGGFSLDDVYDGICRKLILRHPHVFGENVLDKSSEVLVKWEEIKSEEKGYKSYADDLYDVVRSLPELKRAEKIQKRAAKAGFDWEDSASVKEKIEEELSELSEAMENGTNVKEEIGDLLFTVVNLARKEGIDAEEALSDANKKFIARFDKMEKLYSGEKDFADVPMEEKNVLWEKSKQNG